MSWRAQIISTDKKCMWKHLVNADLSRVAATGEWGNVWRPSAKNPPSYCWDCCVSKSFAALLSIQAVKQKSWGQLRGTRSLKKVVDELNQYTINAKFPQGGSQPFNLNRSLNDTTVYLSFLLLLPGRTNSKKRVRFPPSCSTPVSQQERICGLNPQLVKISASPTILLKQLCISPAKNLLLSSQSSREVV